MSTAPFAKLAVHTLAILTLATTTAWTGSVIGSKHDLSAVGSGTIKAATEREVCAFCHTPHRALEDGPLWGHALSTANYIPYSSSTAEAQIGQPTGASKLCLSCHDGTVALGMLVNRPQPVAMVGGVTTMPPGRSNLGTDLSDDHPVSFTYDSALAGADGNLRDPGTLDDRVRLDALGRMQCTACHNPHDDQYGQFLVMPNEASALCLECHNDPSWINSTHRNSPARWNGSGTDPWPHTDDHSVSDNACANCHTPHEAGTPPRLLTFAGAETPCTVCHNGNVAAQNIAQEFDKFSVHPIATTSAVHDPMEDLVNAERHVACADCHNPHATKGTSASAPNASGRLAGLAGINAGGAQVRPLAYEYELCFRCHGDSNNRGESHVTRQHVETNTRLEFATTSASYHPVIAPGKNDEVPSLISPWTTSSVMYCTDCHNNDEGPGNGGSGPNGPHGSPYEPILARQLEWVDPQPESSVAYALCYKCHDRSSILDDQSFPEHKKHVEDEDTACSTCHDPHGVTGKTHLINFNTTYVSPSSEGRLEFVDEGRLAGACYLTCHGTDHNPERYGD